MNRRNDFMGHNRVIHRAGGGGAALAGFGGAKTPLDWSGAWCSPSFSPAAITDMRDGSRVEYASPAHRTNLAVSRAPSTPSSGGSGGELVDMSVIDRIISQRVATQISAQIAPLQAQNVLQQEQNARQQAHNEALQKEVEALKGGV